MPATVIAIDSIATIENEVDQRVAKGTATTIAAKRFSCVFNLNYFS